MKLKQEIEQLLKKYNYTDIIVIAVKDDEVACAVIGDKCKLAQALKHAVDNNSPLKEVFDHAAKHAIHDLLENATFNSLIKSGKVHKT